jgi:hypothetical protein
MTTQPPLADTSPSPWSAVAGATALLTLIISVLIIAFAWPSVRSSVHDVPIAVAGPTAAVKQVSAALDQRLPDAFEITSVADTAAAERLIRDREVYGAIDVSAGTAKVLTASAASVSITQSLQNVATALGQAQTPGASLTVPVRDVVPLPADDPRGAGLAASAFPLVMGGMLAATVLTQLLLGTGRRVIGALAFAMTGGLAMAAILQFWFGSLAGPYFVNSGAIALSIAAISMAILGLESLLGIAGLGLGAATMLLVGNPLSGASTAPHMLPGWSGVLGQLLPPGAGGQLLRSTAFFDDHGATHSVIVLSTWLCVGLVLCAVGSVRNRHRAAAVSDAPAELAMV